jgi:hypothetical protein
MYICVSYRALNGISGQGGFVFLRNQNDGGFPAIGLLRIDPKEIPVLVDLAIHELGHALGIGTLPIPCPSLGNSIANNEYQAISKCTTNVPTEQPSCFHFDEACLGVEMMTPLVSPGSLLSRMSIGWLDDIGYPGLNYTAADPYGM